ncbi:MAG: DNA polymerase Y family protein [Hyphomicrobiales bacterium]
MAVSPQAVALGLSPGMTLADARARVPGLAAIDIDRPADTAWLERMADFCDRYTPLVALDGTDGVVLDITGCAHLFGGEAALRNDLHERCTKAGMEMVSAIAATPDTARALARFGGGAIVETGQEPSAVAALPVGAIGMSNETALALNRAGLVSVGDLAARPRAPLAARFGANIITNLSRVLGEEDIAIIPRRPLPPCTVDRRFGEPIGREDDVLATIEHLIDEASKMLEKRGQGGTAFEASLFRTDGAVRRLTVETSLPTRKAAPLMRLFRERIDTLADPLDPGFGYDLLRLSVHASAPFAQAQTSLDSHDMEDEEVAALIDTLSTRLGKQAVQRFVSAQTHIPERAAYEVAAKDYPSKQLTKQMKMPDLQWGEPQADSPPQRPIHLFQHPQRIEALAQIPDGPPLKFRWRRVLHEVARAEGPERIAPEWWRTDDASLTRDYYRLEDSQGRRFWVFREGLYVEETQHPGWFVHGLFA